jgi:hypothetical protein
MGPTFSKNFARSLVLLWPAGGGGSDWAPAAGCSGRRLAPSVWVAVRGDFEALAAMSGLF